jgi:3-oxoadipate enol-lactonase/4-carboxymuconolactone decarboxylase
MWHARAATVRAHGTGVIAGAAPERWFTPAFIARAPALVASVVEMLKLCDPEGYAGCCEAIASWDERERLGLVSSPTLVVAGNDDPVTPPAHAYAVAAGVRAARVVVVEHASHLAVLERPTLIARLLLDHLARPALSDDASVETRDQADVERARRGEAIRRAVLGDAHVDRARANTTEFSAPFQDLVNRYPWGEIWARPGLSRAERSIVTLTVLAALQHEDELAMHVVAALRNGLTPEQIQQILLQLGVYAGVPVANRAFAVAERALEQAGALRDPRGRAK